MLQFKLRVMECHLSLGEAFSYACLDHGAGQADEFPDCRAREVSMPFMGNGTRFQESTRILRWIFPCPCTTRCGFTRVKPNFDSGLHVHRIDALVFKF